MTADRSAIKVMFSSCKRYTRSAASTSDGKWEIAKMVSAPRSACNVLQMAAELSGFNGQNKVSGTF